MNVPNNPKKTKIPNKTIPSTTWISYTKITLNILHIPNQLLEELLVLQKQFGFPESSKHTADVRLKKRINLETRDFLRHAPDLRSFHWVFLFARLPYRTLLATIAAFQQRSGVKLLLIIYFALLCLNWIHFVRKSGLVVKRTKWAHLTQSFFPCLFGSFFGRSECSRKWEYSVLTWRDTNIGLNGGFSVPTLVPHNIVCIYSLCTLLTVSSVFQKD